MNLADHYQQCALKAYLSGFTAFSNAIIDVYRLSEGRPATGLEMPKNSPPDTPLRPTPQQKRHALKQSHNPWGANA